MVKGADNNLMKSLGTSLLVCIPTFCLSVYLIEHSVQWRSPGAVMLVILGLTAANFAAVVFLEHYRSKLGSLTLPALLGAVGVVMAFIIMEEVNRFVRDFGYEWLLPLVVLYIGLSLFAIFREKTLWMKFFLGFNTSILSILWSLAAADRLDLPF